MSGNLSQILLLDMGSYGLLKCNLMLLESTLKRDGSDFSAAIMGALFRARQVTIWTDVDGVYSADPRRVSEAVILRKLSYQEAWEMNIFNLSASGSTICCLGQNLESPVKGFATIDNLALVNVEGTGMAGVPGTASAIFGSVKDVGANVIMIPQVLTFSYSSYCHSCYAWDAYFSVLTQASSEHSVCFVVPEKEVKAVAKALQSRFRQALDAERLSHVLFSV
ncbi:hypothetical protein V6N13_042884 [Hibiscus sabdariffa]|uniref:aspartate kinase n=1 Tax=Hibiscus sabdariffa TaxID=183260 RepID=A0ABR2G487_9ROSI